MAKLSFTFGANRWFSFTFETDSRPATTASLLPLVKNEVGTIGPSNLPLESERHTAHALIENLVSDLDRLSKITALPLPVGLNRKPHLSAAQDLQTPTLVDIDCDYIDLDLRKSNPPESPDIISNSNGVSPIGSSVVAIDKEVHKKSGCHFLRIPVEVRHLIYDLVLVSKASITNVNRLLDSDDVIDATNYEARIEDIDARLLRTCRAVHQEATPILYGKNTFHFSTQDQIEAFKGTKFPNPFKTLESADRLIVPSNIKLTSERYGRLACVRKVILQIGPSDRFAELLTRDHKRTRNNIWREWRLVFDRQRYYCLLEFSMLETLTLDLFDWLLNADDSVKVDRFVKKFKTGDGLNHLTIIGMFNEKNLRDLKAGLVKAGGVFEVLPC